MKRALIKANGWIGDALHVLPLAARLKKEKGFDEVDVLCYMVQPTTLISYNKDIDRVIFRECDESDYTYIFTMPVIDSHDETNTIQFQKACGLTNNRPEYHIETHPQLDEFAKVTVDSLRVEKRSVIAVQGDWDSRRAGAMDIVRRIESEGTATIILIGSNPIYRDLSLDIRGCDVNPLLFSYTASLIKACDMFLGAEGGLANLSAGVRTPTWITTCHMWKMFGPNGEMSQSDDPKLGPCHLFPNDPRHKHFCHQATNEEIFGIITSALQQ
jgi:hypothetical protein